MKVLNMLAKVGGIILSIGVISACVNLGATEQPPQNIPVNNANAAFVQCNAPRPEICYEIYQPVCALRDTGVRCTTTPCPSTERVSYPNDCKACADSIVYGFQRGDCNATNTTGLDGKLEQWVKG
uniref:Kazal-like domain-containing protein n=1 Tax=uncultured Thiotrichaceae bacterium TaxID=298394 RepID=A0A6S6ULR4_9GAMM|nr:MAG: Unknown protein [uncultured Thiotrichaceae bacterium]